MDEQTEPGGENIDSRLSAMCDAIKTDMGAQMQELSERTQNMNKNLEEMSQRMNAITKHLEH